MSGFARRAGEFAAAVLVAPLLLAFSACCLLIGDLTWRLAGTRLPTRNRRPDTRSASVVIPNWNGRDLLEKYLPTVIEAMRGDPGNEVIVVDNGSADGSAEFVRQQFPEVTLLALAENLGFGGGSNAGFRAARNDVVVLLNSDMRTEAGFLAPLLAGFASDDVFAVSCQIFLTDPEKRREETGLTEGWWEDGKLRVSHREDPAVDRAFPCFYAGGGSSAFDRAKFLELGGFDELLAPFYLEDTDLGFLAWKRGWKVLYEPASIVFHEHRGTIGRKFTPAFIDTILSKNYLLFNWKNVHDWGRLLQSFASAWGGSVASAWSGKRPLRSNVAGILRAFRQLPGAVRSRRRARDLAAVSDQEAFARSRGSHFRDRFLPAPTDSERLRVLFVSPYPILPPAHGGAVFMLQTLRELAKQCEVHALVLLDEPSQAEANRELADVCATVDLMIRPRNSGLPSIAPHAVAEFASRDVQWRIDRLVLLHRVDLVQIEYTAMGQYIDRYRHIATALFEHDVYFQSIIRTASHLGSAARWKARFEYLRALRFELQLLSRCDLVQVCTAANRDYLLEFEPALSARVQAGLRAAIDTQSYSFPGGPRRPDSILFIGSSRHKPNKIAVTWFMDRVLPRIAAARPEVRVFLAGFEARFNPELAGHPRLAMLGYVEDVKPLLAECAVFVCPILSGSGVRVKLLEAFASGIPAVSTRIGAEGLARNDGEFCELADDPDEFARRVIQMLDAPEETREMTRRARAEVESEWDSVRVTERLVESYRTAIRAKNSGLTAK